MSEFDNFDRIFAEMIRLTESLFDSEQAEPLPVSEVVPRAKDELIERADSFSYILDAPGYECGQLHVNVLDDEIEVKAPDFVARKPLPSKVDPKSVETNYRNGILSVVVKKKQ